jgi:hypothetical protein
MNSSAAYIRKYVGHNEHDEALKLSCGGLAALAIAVSQLSAQPVIVLTQRLKLLSPVEHAHCTS